MPMIPPVRLAQPPATEPHEGPTNNSTRQEREDDGPMPVWCADTGDRHVVRPQETRELGIVQSGRDLARVRRARWSGCPATAPTRVDGGGPDVVGLHLGQERAVAVRRAGRCPRAPKARRTRNGCCHDPTKRQPGRRRHPRGTDEVAAGIRCGPGRDELNRSARSILICATLPVIETA